MEIDGSITVGELMANPKTAAVVQQLMAQAMGGAQDSGEMSAIDGNDEMVQAMMRFMPLKSLISFGRMNDEQLQGLLAMLKNAL